MSSQLSTAGTRRAEHPPEVLLQPQSREVEAGERLELIVQAQGYPEPRVEFFKNGTKVNCNENYSLGEFELLLYPGIIMTSSCQSIGSTGSGR